ncbi:MAG: hypothetical protein MSIBF_03220 [Candidatus Altiarchaeales archaeon IMC4]|nr:MAG: hypothetical protein MSIBF_03220 [Candidatus Altiarchaeales archaeon IMC4]
MTEKIVYLTKESVMFVNEVINIMSNRKADKYELLSTDGFIDAILEKVRNTEGDVYDKAAVLMRELITCHGFASGNKRTAYITASYFIIKNGGKVKFKNFNKVETIIRNIRNFSTEESPSGFAGVA